MSALANTPLNLTDLKQQSTQDDGRDISRKVSDILKLDKPQYSQVQQKGDSEIWKNLATALGTKAKNNQSSNKLNAA